MKEVPSSDKLTGNTTISLARRSIRVALVVMLSILILLIGFTSFLYIQRDQIAEELLLTINTRINGEIQFDEVSFNPFVEFPKMSVDLNGTSLYLNSDSAGIESTPFARMERIRGALNINSLFDDQLMITEIILENGEFNLVRYQDSTFNIDGLIIEENAIQKKDNNQDSTIQVLDFDLNLEQLRMNDITVTSENQILDNFSSVSLQNLVFDLSIDSLGITGSLNATVLVDSLSLAGIERIDDAEVTLQTAIHYSTPENILTLDKSLLATRNSTFEFEGFLDFNEEGSLDFRLRAEDPFFSLSEYLLKNVQYEDLESGNIFLDGRVYSDSFYKMPIMDFDFGIKSLKMNFPRINGALKDLTVIGRFESGTKADLSEASLAVDTLYGEFKDGFVKGALFLNDLTHPKFDLYVTSRLEMGRSAEQIKFKELENISGHLESNIVVLAGDLNLNSNDFTYGFMEADLTFDSLTMALPGAFDISYLNGRSKFFDGTENIDKLLGEKKAIHNHSLIETSLSKYSPNDSICSADIDAIISVYGVKNQNLKPLHEFLTKFSGKVTSNISLD